MYLRFIRLVVREGSEPAFQKFYRGRVIPSLAEVPGCLYAALLTPWRSEEHRSLTLWRSAEDAAAYEASGLYHDLLRETSPLLSGRTVWRARLTSDPLETQGPDDQELGGKEIPPEGYELGDGEADPLLERVARSVFVRVVAVHIAPQHTAEFRTIFHEQVIPALRKVPGCLGALLAEGANDRNEALSITIWDREESATRYEMSGEFERLTRRLESTLSQLSQWHLTLGERGAEKERAPEVASYHLVHSRTIR